jgi:hypothetical protein
MLVQQSCSLKLGGKEPAAAAPRAWASKGAGEAEDLEVQYPHLTLRNTRAICQQSQQREQMGTERNRLDAARDIWMREILSKRSSDR